MKKRDREQLERIEQKLDRLLSQPTVPFKLSTWQGVQGNLPTPVLLDGDEYKPGPAIGAEYAEG